MDKDVISYDFKAAQERSEQLKARAHAIDSRFGELDDADPRRAVLIAYEAGWLQAQKDRTKTTETVLSEMEAVLDMSLTEAVSKLAIVEREEKHQPAA